MNQMRHSSVLLCLFLLAASSALHSDPRPTRIPIAPKVESASRLRRHSRIYIVPMGGFESTLFAALDKEVVPLVIVASPHDAEFQIKEMGESRVSWARLIFASEPLVSSQPEIVVSSLRTGETVLICPLQSISSIAARQRTAENCAKLLKRKVLEK